MDKKLLLKLIIFIILFTNAHAKITTNHNDNISLVTIDNHGQLLQQKSVFNNLQRF